MRHQLGQRGVTLVELMVTIAVIGIMAAIAVPNIRGVMPRTRLKNNTMVLSNEIALSRVRAIAKSTRVRIVLNPADDSYTIERESGGVWVRMATNKTSGTDLASAANFTTANAVIADWNGSFNVAFTGIGHIILQTPEGDYRKAVMVEPIGRVSVRRWTGGSTTDPSGWPEE